MSAEKKAVPNTLPTLCGSMAAQPHRLAVAMHNAAYRALGLEYTFVYFGIADPQAGVQAIRTLGIRGMNVSMPFKSAVIPFLDHLDPAAEAIGAVNTIDNRDGVLTGFNTDYLGAVRALEEKTGLDGKRVALLGAGGAGRAVAYGLVSSGARVTVYNRSPERAEELAADFRLRIGGTPDRFPADERYDILVNATSVGFNDPAACVIGKERLRSDLIVMDAVFQPLETGLLKAAKSAGCETISGERMLLHQACGQVARYTGCEAPLAVMEEAVARELSRRDD